MLGLPSGCIQSGGLGCQKADMAGLGWRLTLAENHLRFSNRAEVHLIRRSDHLFKLQFYLVIASSLLNVIFFRNIDKNDKSLDNIVRAFSLQYYSCKMALFSIIPIEVSLSSYNITKSK